MKKKLLTMAIALSLTASLPIAAIGCDDGNPEHTHTYATEWTADDTHHWKSATCEHTAQTSEKAAHVWGADGKCTTCQKKKEITATVTQEEWVNFFDSLNTISFVLEMSAPQVNISHSFKQHNNVFYWEQAMNGESEITYTRYDEDTYTVTTYWRNWTDVAIEETEGVWEKITKVANDQNGYLAFQERYWGLGCSMLGEGFALQQGGEELGLSDLYSAFTYISDSDAYTANLYWNETGDMVVSFKFENGKIVSGSLTQTVDEQSVTMDFTFDYSITELVIPVEILNAPENA